MFIESGKTILLRREFRTPVENLYAAWSNPDLFKKWWSDLKVAEMDFREGGAYRLMWEGAEDSVSGTYKQIVPNELIVFTWTGTGAWKEIHENIITLKFKSKDPNASEFELKHELSPTEKWRGDHHEGWIWAMLDLDKYFNSSSRKIREDLKAQVSRTYPFPAARVYEAWTNEKFMASWFNRRTATLGTAKADVKVGGSFFMDYQKEDGDLIRIYGTYKEVVPLERLVFSWVEDNHSAPPTADRQAVSRVTVNFKDIGEKTEVTIVHDQLTSEALMNDFIEGWTDCLASIENRLSTVKT